MTNLLTQKAGIYEDMRQEALGKRKLPSIFEDDLLPPAKRRRLMVELSARFLKKVREWHERRRKIMIGLMLYRDEQTRDARRMARKRASSELFSEYEGLVQEKYRKILEETTILPPPLADTIITAQLKVNISEENPTRKGLIKRLSNNAEATEVQEVKVNQVKQRRGWRRMGEKRSSIIS